VRAVFVFNPPSTAPNGERSAHTLLLQFLQDGCFGEVRAWTVETNGKFAIGSKCAGFRQRTKVNATITRVKHRSIVVQVLPCLSMEQGRGSSRENQETEEQSREGILES